jgi:hypothetical protein
LRRITAFDPHRGEVVEGKAGVFSLCVGLATLTVLSASGCQPAQQAKQVENVSEDPWGEAIKVAGAILRYADANGRLPESKEALQGFCQKESLTCATLDWSRVSWQHRDSDSLTVNYHTSQGITIPITMGTDPGSLRVGNNNMPEELENKLRALMER